MRPRKYIKEPYLLLILCSLLMGLMPLFVNGKVDIISHDTYFVIHRSILYAAAAIFSGLVWLIYFCANSALPSKFLTRVHIYSVVVFTFTWIIFDLTGLPKHEPSAQPKTYADYGRIDYTWDNIVLITVGVLFMLGVACFFLNFIIGLVRLLRRKFT